MNDWRKIYDVYDQPVATIKITRSTYRPTLLGWFLAWLTR